MTFKALSRGVFVAAFLEFHTTVGRLSGNPGLRGLDGDNNIAHELDRKLTSSCSFLPSFEETQSPETAVSFIAIGAIPFSYDDRGCLNGELRDIDLISPDTPSFMIQLGDSLNSRECNEKSYNNVANQFAHPENSINYDPRDCFFIPGDKDWNGCKNGMDDAWDKWTQILGPKSLHEFGTLSSENVTVERQTGVYRPPGVPGVERSENFAFFMNNVLFIGLNLVGGNEIGDEQIRLAQNFNWTRDKLEYYSSKKEDMKAAVIFGHADLTTSNSRREYFGNPLKDLLRNGIFRKLPVMYVHATGKEDGLCISAPSEKNPHYVSVRVDKGINAKPVQISVRHVGDTYKFDINERGGRYSPDSCPKIGGNTWSSRKTKPIETLSPMSNSPPTKKPKQKPASTVADSQDGKLTSMATPKKTKAPEMVYTPPSIELSLVAEDTPDSAYPLSVCQGDCDNDAECADGLLCFKREGKEPVPGCLGSGTSKKDYCFQPPWNTLIIVEGDGAHPMGECRGDCDSDGDCDDGLLCFKREDKESVPGCIGKGVSKKDYCYHAANFLALVGNDGDPGSTFPLGKCEGDCDEDSDCKPGLFCFHRSDLKAVPNCMGEGKKGRDYCTDFLE